MILDNNRFRIETVNVLLDSLSRGKVYEHMGKKFKFLFDLGNKTEKVIDDDSMNLVISYYASDIDRNLKTDCVCRF